MIIGLFRMDTFEALSDELHNFRRFRIAVDALTLCI